MGISLEEANARVASQPLQSTGVSLADAQRQMQESNLRERLQRESWLPRNIEGFMTAPSNLWEGAKQTAFEITHPAQYKTKAGETSLIPYSGSKALPREQYDLSKIRENRIIAQEAPVGAAAGNLAVAAPMAFSKAGQTPTGSVGLGALLGMLQPTTEGESRASNIVTGGAAGGIVPATGLARNKMANALSNQAEKMLYSALKPTETAYKTNAARDAVDTILKTKGLYPTKGGVNKLQSMIDNLNEQIKSKITNSNEKIELRDVVKKLDDLKHEDVYSEFLYQVNPEKDLETIESSGKEFLRHPLFRQTSEEGAPYSATEIPVQLAQKMKQATYKSLGGKAYGEVGSAARESQKALARGLREGVASKVEDVNELNKAEGKLINAQDVIERAANRAANREMGGLAYLMHPWQAATYLFERNPATKAALAKALYAIGKNKVPPGVTKTARTGAYATIPELTQGEE